MKLNSKEREQLLRASEMIASGEALYIIQSHLRMTQPVCKKFNDFYDEVWDLFELTTDQRQCARVLMLLWFREVANETHK